VRGGRWHWLLESIRNGNCTPEMASVRPFCCGQKMTLLHFYTARICAVAHMNQLKSSVLTSFISLRRCRRDASSVASRRRTLLLANQRVPSSHNNCSEVAVISAVAAVDTSLRVAPEGKKIEIVNRSQCLAIPACRLSFLQCPWADVDATSCPVFPQPKMPCPPPFGHNRRDSIRSRRLLSFSSTLIV
jgi:hypothetical protein